MLKSALSSYHRFINDQADERTTHWFFVHSPLPVVTLLAGYLLIVCDVGPRFMKNRKPYNVDRLMIAYNLFQVFMCGVVVVRLVPEVWKADFFCEEINYDKDAAGMSVPITTYIIYWLKICDLLDTIFFVLRKKYNQITFLHVYHHTIMVFYVWLCLKYVAGGQMIYLGFINSFVHMVMYFYYMMTAYNPAYKKSPWWKKHITQLQLVQFFMSSVYMTMPLTQKDCNYPIAVPLMVLPQLFAITVLFADFYYKTYIRSKPTIKPLEVQTNGISKASKNE